MEEEQAVLHYAAEFADARLAEDRVTDHEKYYAGLIYYLHGSFEKAISILKSIFPACLPAGNKLVEIYEALDSPEAPVMTERIKMEESLRPVYGFGIPATRPRHDPAEFLEDISSVIHFMEIQPSVGQVFVKPMDIRNTFFNAIQLYESDNQKESLSLQDKAAKAWQQVLETEVDERKLEDKFNGFSHFQDPARELGELIEHGAKAELYDLKEKHRLPVHFDFKLYLALNFRPYQKGFITQTQASCVNEYLYACMDSLPVFTENGAKKYLLNAVRDYFLDDAIPYMGHIKKLTKLLEIIRQETKGTHNPILNYEAFMKLRDGQE